jgi:ABC-type polysaccharide/polyol phosphate export permease
LSILRTALADLNEGLRKRKIAIALAHEDIGDQHRRTALGPVWLLINYLSFACTFIFVFQRGDSGAANYPAYVAAGLFVWFFIMETLTQSVSLFVREESFIKGTTLPLSIYVLRLFMQSTIRAAYALAGCLAILALSGIDPSGTWAWSALGMALILAIAPAAITVFAFLGAYVPDMQFVVANIMRLGMFLTPVFWSYEGSSGVRHVLYHYNPFTYFLEIVRAPIVGGDFVFAFLFCLAVGAALWFLAILLIGTLRRQVAFVL